MRFGAYEVIEKFGAGGMGDIWIGVHSALGRAAAIKVIRPDALGKSGSADVLKRFEREARATSTLRSPHTIEIYDFGITSDGVFYYAMELLEGCNLRTLVDRAGPVPAGRAAWILRQVCDSLEEAHRAGLVHRDVKPANIHLCKLGLSYDFAKVLDFGLVKTGGDEQLTQAERVHGTPAFMPPEITQGTSSLDARSDIYSLGCVAYWLVTGQLVFEADTPLAAVVHHAQTPPVPPSQRVEIHVQPEFEAIVMACLAKDPRNRPSTASELSRLLGSCDYDPPWAARDAEDWWLMHQPQTWAAPDVHGAPSKILRPRELHSAHEPSTVERPVIAVLPFDNKSGDDDQEYFSDGITEDIITALSRYPWFSVIARATTFAFKQRSLGASELGNQLGARYLVEGSVRRSTNRVRVSVQLIDAESGNQVWAERYDRELADVFVVQDEITRAIVGELTPEFLTAEVKRSRRKTEQELDAWDLVMRGREQLWRLNRQCSIEAQRYFERAIERAPQSGLGLADLALTFYVQLAFGWVQDREQTIVKMGEVSAQAIVANPNDPDGFVGAALTRLFLHDATAAIEFGRKSIAANPNHAFAHATLGNALVFAGQYEAGIESLNHSIHLSPRDPLVAIAWTVFGLGHYQMKRYDLAERAGRRATVEQPSMPGGFRLLASSLAQLGRLDEARRVVEDHLLQLIPGHTAEEAGRQLPFGDNEEGRRHFLEGLIKAGLPA